MTSSLPLFELVVAGILLIATAIVAFIVVLRLRDHWMDRRLCEAAERNQVLADLLDRLEVRPSMPVRRALARKQVLQDADRLDQWIRKSGGVDEAGVPQQPFPDTRLMDRYLLQVRRGSDDLPRAVAAGLLGWTARPEIVAPLLATAGFATGRAPVLRATVMGSLGMMRHPAALSALVDALEDPEKDMGDAIIRALVDCGEAAIAPAAKALADTDRPTALRRRCARVLGGLELPGALAPLLEALADAQADLRAQAAESLSTSGDERAVEALSRLLLEDPVLLVRAAVARALSVLAPRRTFEQLARAMSDPLAERRGRVIEALEQFGPPARPLLEIGLSDPDADVARASARALESNGLIAAALDRLAEHGYDAETTEFLIRVGRAGHLDPLLRALDGARPGLTPQIVRVLARVGNPAAGDALARLLDHVGGDTLRARIVEALCRVGAAEHTGRIEKLLGARDEWLRKAAVDYLARFGDPTVTDRVLPLLEDTNPWVRSSVLKVLEALASHGIDLEAVRDRLTDPYDFVRAQAVSTLCAARAFEILLEADVMDHIAEERVRGALLRGLGDHATPAAMPLVTRLAAFCADADLDLLRHAARRAVSGLQPAEIDLLLLGNADPEQESSARWFAAIAWSRARDNAAASWREDLLNDADPRVRAAMVAALADREEDRADQIVAVHHALEDSAPTVVRAGLCALARLGLHELEAAATDALEHEDESVRVDALLVQALLPGAASRVDDLARPDHTRAQRIAATAARLSLNDPAALIDWVGHLRLGSDRRIIECWITDEHALFAHLRERARSEPDRVGASILLCRSAFEAEEHLAAILATHPHDTERRLALHGLVDAGGERCVGAIRSAFYRDPSARIRADALSHLVERFTGDDRSEFLESALASEDPVLRLRAVRLCAALPAKLAAELLGRTLGQGGQDERDAVVERLAGLVQERGEEILDFVLHPRREPAALADLARVLDFCTLPVCADLLESLFSHDDPGVRAAAIRPLVRRGGRGASSAVERGIADPVARVRAQTLKALAATAREDLTLGDDELLSVLRRAHEDPDPEVRSRTALAVARLRLEGTGGILGTLEHDADARVERIAREARKEYERRPARSPVS